jgi:hypothetical protein
VPTETITVKLDFGKKPRMIVNGIPKEVPRADVIDPANEIPRLESEAMSVSLPQPWMIIIFKEEDRAVGIAIRPKVIDQEKCPVCEDPLKKYSSGSINNYFCSKCDYRKPMAVQGRAQEDGPAEGIEAKNDCVPQGIVAYTQEPKNLDEDEQAVWNVLKHQVGKENSIKVRDLERKSGLPHSDDKNRQTRVRGIVQRLILKHYVPIGSSNPKGYYIIKTKEEMEEACRFLLAPALKMIKRVARIKRVASHILMKQIIMEEMENEKLNNEIDQELGEE